MNPVALITGASRGIGRGIALELAKTRHDLALNFAGDSRAAEKTTNDCRAVAKEMGHTIRVATCRADVSVGTDRKALIGFVRSTFGRLDLLVNNAGVAPSVRADILEATEESFDRLMEVNAKGPYFLSQLAAKWMIEQVGARPCSAAAAMTGQVGVRSSSGAATPARPRAVDSASDQGRGETRPKIVNISSISAYTASVNRGDYCIAKAGLSMVTKLFAARLAEFGINVYEIRPGIIATDMTAPVKKKYDQAIKRGLTPISRWGTPEDIGRAVTAIAQDLLPFSTGEVINVDGGFHLRRL